LVQAAAGAGAASGVGWTGAAAQGAKSAYAARARGGGA
jgi:hypothetical protein